MKPFYSYTNIANIEGSITLTMPDGAIYILDADGFHKDSLDSNAMVDGSVPHMLLKMLNSALDYEIMKDKLFGARS
jgi:hypothetical protein